MSSENYGEGVYGENIYSGLFCGDGICSNELFYSETCSSCSGDCGICPVELPTIGEGGLVNSKNKCSLDKDCKENMYCLNHTCVEAECLNDSFCNNLGGEFCLDHQCKKLFNLNITLLNSSVVQGEFLDFKYSLNSTENVSGDFEMYFWVEHDGKIISSGKDIHYLNCSEGKFFSNKLHIPNDAHTEDCRFFVKIVFAEHSVTSDFSVKVEPCEKNMSSFVFKDKEFLICFLLLTFCVLIIILIKIIRKKKHNKLFGKF